MASYRDSEGTAHVLPDECLRQGEDIVDFFIRVGKEKPNPQPWFVCQLCGADHRGPREFWPEEERALHEHAEGLEAAREWDRDLARKGDGDE